MVQTLFLQPAISVGKLKKILAQFPDNYGLVPSQIYHLFVVDKDGHSRGYISTSGELHWWSDELGASGGKGPKVE